LRNVSQLYFAVRSLDKGAAARDELLSDKAIQKANPSASIKLYELDQSNYTSVVAFSEKFNAEVKTLDVAILNAGCGIFKFTPTPPGNEIMLQVNHLSTALLSLLLLPLLESSSKPGRPSHLTFVASIGGHKTPWEKEPFKSLPASNIIMSLNDTSGYGGFQRYGMSKMFVQMWTTQLANRIPREKVVINSVCPGFTVSSIDRGLPFYARPLMSGVRSLIGRSTKMGATTYVIAATGPADSHGRFYSDGIVIK